jgi:hypothetical protein
MAVHTFLSIGVFVFRSDAKCLWVMCLNPMSELLNIFHQHEKSLVVMTIGQNKAASPMGLTNQTWNDPFPFQCIENLPVRHRPS